MTKYWATQSFLLLKLKHEECRSALTTFLHKVGIKDKALSSYPMDFTCNTDFELLGSHYEKLIIY